MLHILNLAGQPIEHFPDRFAAQLNDTHPSVAVAELMRLLVDERQLDWDFIAKRIIKLINAVGEVINNDPDVNKYLCVAFVPNFNVQNGQLIYPAADLSEQISTAAKEASGTGNMKFTLNGALTIGTLDGANVEIREEVWAENFFLFGLTEDEVVRVQREGYNPAAYIEVNPQLAETIHLIASGHFSHGDTEVFQSLVDNLRQHDPFLVLADYSDYVACQDKVTEVWKDQEQWTRMSILNTARAGKFSSDRAIREYCEEIWKVKPVSVELSIQPPHTKKDKI
jgi:starch phosphorylase